MRIFPCKRLEGEKKSVDQESQYRSGIHYMCLFGRIFNMTEALPTMSVNPSWEGMGVKAVTYDSWSDGGQAVAAASVQVGTACYFQRDSGVSAARILAGMITENIKEVPDDFRTAQSCCIVVSSDGGDGIYDLNTQGTSYYIEVLGEGEQRRVIGVDTLTKDHCVVVPQSATLSVFSIRTGMPGDSVDPRDLTNGLYQKYSQAKIDLQQAKNEKKAGLVRRAFRALSSK